ncbi:MAG: family 78 glycoside hydrolase catalytic domain [Ignavibacteriales bacterium]|nr:family 78 glycoside hydrolase catalytic domain [Ignavibacteriales bacterium]
MKPPPPHDLRCEYLKDPLGVDIERPRLSWVLKHPQRGQTQKAYRIIVSSTQDFALNYTGDLWDSRRVDSPATAHISYGGTPMRSRQKCYWRVQWWDNQDRPSEYSEVATFEFGLLDLSDWNAEWISKEDCREFTSKGTVLLGEFLGDYINCYALYLRKIYMLTKPVARARAYICGLGCYEMSINGFRVGDRVLDPAQTDYKKVSLYSTYDITATLAESVSGKSAGAFAVGVILGNGRHIKNYGYGHPKVIVQIFVEHDDGSTVTFVSNKEWRVTHGPLQENGLYFGERYDARLEMFGWDQPAFDDSTWKPATEVQEYPLSSQLLPPIRVVETRKPKKLSELKGKSQIYDSGQNCSGWVRISVRGERGAEVRLRHAELLNEDGSLSVSPNQNAEATDVYVLSGAGIETYEPRFTYHGFRYFEISGLPSLPEIVSVEVCLVHSDVEQIGNFKCSNELINKVHQNILMGQLSNLMGIPTDCAQRDERHGWLGDAHLAAEESMFNFDMEAFYRKFLVDIRHAQKEDGSLPDVVPPYTGRLYPADPAWSSAYVTIAWLVYLMYGDVGILEDHYDSMNKYIGFLRANAEGNVIRALGKYGDWCPPGSIAPKRTPVELTATWFYYHDTLVLSKIAHALKRDGNYEELQKLALDIRRAFNETFLWGDEYAVNRFAPVDRSPSQTSNALPLYLRMVPAEKKERVLGRLLHSIIEEQDYHLDTGILGTRYLLDVLTENGHADVAYKVASQRTYPGWGYMVEEGATTLWERWEKITGGGMNSRNHIMLGSVDAWFYRALAGISCLTAGWSQILIKPHIIEGLSFAEADVRTIKGPACVSWHRSAQALLLKFSIPVGCVGQVFVPIPWEKSTVEEKGRTLWQNGSARPSDDTTSRYVGIEEQHVHFEFGSGEYQLRVAPSKGNSIQ